MLRKKPTFRGPLGDGSDETNCGSSVGSRTFMSETLRSAVIYRSYSETEPTAAGSGAVEIEGPESMERLRYENVVGQGRCRGS